jgi:hypothetical protein
MPGFASPRSTPAPVLATRFPKLPVYLSFPPAHAVPAFQAGGGRVFSTEPTDVELFNGEGGFGLIRDFMMQLVFDMSDLSAPGAQAFLSRDTIKVSDNIRLPEHSGQDSMGLLCGAIGPEFFSHLPMISSSEPFQYLKNRGDQAGMPYRFCENGVLTDQCDSLADLIQHGGPVCIDLENIDDLYTSLLEWMEVDVNCYRKQGFSRLCFYVVRGIDFDVDSDGDGVNDSWSVLLGYETYRIRIYDVAQ